MLGFTALEQRGSVTGTVPDVGNLPSHRGRDPLLGCEWLIRGSAPIARTFGVKPLVVGLTVVAYGTSAPELAVATKTALDPHEPIALGTVVGSCAAKSADPRLTALISPPTIDSRIIRREVPVLLGSAIAVPILFRNGVLSRLEGLLLVAAPWCSRSRP